MRTIGLLGGMSWESTAVYYRLANELVAERLGGLHSADLLVRSVDFAVVEQMQVDGDWEAASRLLADEARRLEDCGAELVVLCTNTMHLVAPGIEQALSVPFVHLLDATAAAVDRAGVHRVGLLGTTFTMEQPFYRERLEAAGLEVFVPAETDRALVHRVIYDELCRGVLREESRLAYLDVIDRLVSDGAEGVVLGCTEIELLLPMTEHAGVPLFPTTRIHVEAAVGLALSPSTLSP